MDYVRLSARVVASFATLVAVLLVVWPVQAATAVFTRPQDRPAEPSAQAALSPLLAVTQAGTRIVAVGLRGHIVLSDDGGQNWRQAAVPVSSDLLAVSFPTPLQGWAVGHGGVVLHSADGGASWQRQLGGEPPAADGGTPSLLDVHFENERTGYVVGTFNRILRTDDGGKTWASWSECTDNPQELHFYAIRGGASGLYLAGEQGMVWRLDEATQRFVAIPTPYKGTLFGLVTAGRDELLVFGMRGSLFRSADRGRTWARIATGSSAGITGGAALPDGRLLLVDQAGGLGVSGDHGQSFRPVKPAQPMPYFGVAALGGGRIGLVGAQGVRLEALGNAP
jgi:photosystem II stability/assembly factor-like uncharacterized protein